jgi:hypothetical protein
MSDSFDYIIEGLERFVGHRVQVHLGGMAGAPLLVISGLLRNVEPCFVEQTFGDMSAPEGMFFYVDGGQDVGQFPAFLVPGEPDYADVQDATVHYQFNGAAVMVMKVEG